MTPKVAGLGGTRGASRSGCAHIFTDDRPLTHWTLVRRLLHIQKTKQFNIAPFYLALNAAPPARLFNALVVR